MLTSIVCRKQRSSTMMLATLVVTVLTLVGSAFG
jgi:hypothetical protein